MSETRKIEFEGKTVFVTKAGPMIWGTSKEFVAWEVSPVDERALPLRLPSHSTIRSLSDLGASAADFPGFSAWVGRLGTERAPDTIEKLRGGSPERIALADAFHAEIYGRAYRAIVAAFPEADVPEARRSMGQIEIR